MKKIKHKIKLLWLRRKWVIQCVYNTKEFRKARNLLEIEKAAEHEYHRAQRSGDKVEIARAKGGKEIMGLIKEVLQ